MQTTSGETLGLYKVSYKIGRENYSLDLILSKGKKNRWEIAKIISAINGNNPRGIHRIRTKFRKAIDGYAPNAEGNKEYHQHLNIHREKRKRAGYAKRKYTLYKRKYPFNPTSRTIIFSRHLFTTIEQLHETIKREHANQKLQYRFDIQFGLKLRNVETGEIKTFYPSCNTSFYEDGELPIVVDSVDTIVGNLQMDSIIDRVKRPNSKWSVDEVYEYVVLITPFPDKLIGSDIQLPEYINKSKSIIGFESVKNNMCFWHCLAYHYNRKAKLDRLVRASIQLFEKYYGQKPSKDYKGLDILELSNIKDLFKINVNIYVMSEGSVDIERHSNNSYSSTMNLNLYTEPDTNRHHFSFIKNIQNITKVFRCPDCNTYLSEYKKLKPHSLICNGGLPKIAFEDGDYEPQKTVFDSLEQNGILVPEHLRYYPYFIFYDFETWLQKNEDISSGSNLNFVGTHQLLSVSLMGSDELMPMFIPVETSAEDALKEMLSKMNTISTKYLKQMYETNSPYLKQISCVPDKSTRKDLWVKMIKWIEEVPVYGFNSSAYDLNVIKRHLHHLLTSNKRKYGNISRQEKLWLRSVEEGLGRKLEENVQIGKYRVDALDRETNTVYEFNGCFYHGCSQCYSPEYINPLNGKSMAQLYTRTITKEENLKQLGYNVISKWECDYVTNADAEVSNIIKCNNKYRMIGNGQYSFRDITGFLSAGTSLCEFLRAFDTAVPKGVFPHKVTQNIDLFVKEYPHLSKFNGNISQLLKQSEIPGRKWFTNDLKQKQGISEKEYADIKAKYSNLYDLLVEYNNNDVSPTVEATKKLVRFFKDIQLDMHKDGISMPGLTLKYMWKLKEAKSKFQLFNGKEDLYFKYKDNLVGGPSIVFCHYHEKNKSRIRGGNLCKKVIGFDANSLYLYAIGGNMLCSNHQEVHPYDGLIDDIKREKFFGVVECDIQVPQHLHEYFSEMSPIFKNTEVTFNDVSDETKQQVKPTYKSRKLVGSMFGRKMLFHTDLLKWYLNKGIQVSNITYAVQYERQKPFQAFVDRVSNARRQGDKSQEYKLIGEMMKLMGNSSYGKCITNFMKHETTKIVSEKDYARNVIKNNYKSHEDLLDGYEFHFKKTSFKQSLPIQIGFAVYQLAKLRMLEFYYDFIDYYVDRKDFQYCEMDTDSAYIAFSGDFVDVIKPELRQHFEANKHNWLGRDDTEEHKLFDKRTPGLFKVEYEGDGIIALASKMYYCFSDKKDKFSSKGINQKQNEVTKQRYLQALNGNESQLFINKGFRVRHNQMMTYTLQKTGMKLFNDKRLRVGYETFAPLL